MANTPFQTLPYPAGSDSPAGHTQILNLAKAIEKKAVLVFASSAARTTAYSNASYSPTEGQFCWLQDLNHFEYYNGSAWVEFIAAPVAYTSYTPAWTSSGTAPALGNGSSIGFYNQIGKQVHVWGRITFGTTSTFGTGSYRLSLPVAADTNIVFLGMAYMRDPGNGDHYGFVQLVTSTTFSAGGMTGTNTNTTWTPTVPFTIGNGDSFQWNFTYPAA
jgi:hypothetical protein